MPLSYQSRHGRRGRARRGPLQRHPLDLVLMLHLARPLMKLVATRKPEQNTAAVDPWTAVHFSAGLAMGLINVPLPTAVAGALAYEIFEQYFERRGWGKEFFETQGPESFPNVVADIVILIAGHELGRRWNLRR